MGEELDDKCKDCVHIAVIKEILFQVLKIFDKALWALIILALGERLSTMLQGLIK